MNPQTELFQILAESNTRNRSIRSVYARSIDTIDRRYQHLAGQVKAMRQQLEQRPDLQSQYRKAIGDLRRLGQSYALGKMRLTKGSEPIADSPELQKALDYAELLLDIYGNDKPLIKGAGMDLQACASYLRKFDHSKAQELAQKLIALVQV